MDYYIIKNISEDCMKIRKEVFVDEQGFKDEFDDVDKCSYHLIVYDGKIPAATSRLYKISNDTWEIGRVAVRKPYRKHGIGKACIKRLEEKAKNIPECKKIIINGQKRVENFYLKLGYKEINGSTNYDEGCEHIMLEKYL